MDLIKTRDERQRAARGQPLTLSTTVAEPQLPERAGALPERLQDIARQYLGARRQSGVSLLEAARWLSEARQEAKHGEWSIFLEAIGLDESRARAQIRIHEEAQRDGAFADRIINGFLSETVARELLPAPTEVRDELYARQTPPTAQDVRAAKRAATPAFEQPMLPDMPDPVHVDLPPDFAIMQRRFAAHSVELLSNMQGRERAFVIRKAGAAPIVTFNWEEVLDRLSLLEDGMEAVPDVAPAQPSGPFWQSIDAHHPTAHLWTFLRPDLVRSACGMTIQNRLPSGSTEGGHCSSCVRATWNAAAPLPAPPALPTRPRRPRPPRSADSSAVLSYGAQIEDYATQLEAYATQLELLVKALST